MTIFLKSLFKSFLKIHWDFYMLKKNLEQRCHKDTNRPRVTPCGQTYKVSVLESEVGR